MVPFVSPFAGLPQELVMMIIEYASAAIPRLRMTSRVLKQCADEYSMRRQIQPVVEKITFAHSAESGFVSIAMYVPEYISKMVAMRLVCQPPFDVMNRIRIKTQTSQTSRIEPHRYLFEFAPTSDNMSELEYIGVCLGKSIDTVTLDGCTDQAALKAVSSLLDGMQFSQLEISSKSLSNEAVMFLLETVRAQQLDRLSLRIDKFGNFNPAIVLLHLSSFVREIYIEQEEQENMGRITTYFLGLLDFDWAPTIINMFSRKLEKLIIFNPFYQGFLLINSADKLRDKLPLLGKRIYFESSCHVYGSGLASMFNGFSITVNCDDSCTQRNTYLTIKQSP